MCCLVLEPVTLKPEYDLDMVKRYYLTKREISMSAVSKIVAQTNRKTDRQINKEIHTGHKSEVIEMMRQLYLLYL